MQRGDPMELNYEGLEMQKWNIPTNRAQIVDGKIWATFKYNIKKILPNTI